MARIKTLIHLHTHHSIDSNLSLDALERFCRRERFDCVAITDHDTIEGALRFRAMSDRQVIIGEEITTRDGDLIGLFLSERIKPGMSARDTAIAIREQGGLVLAPHPFVKLFGCGLGDTTWEIADLLHAVEVCNGQNLLSAPNRKALHFARETGLPGFVGADSHTASSIAPCYQTMEPFSTPASFLESLTCADLFPGRHPLPYFASAAYRTARYLLGFGFPSDFGEGARSVAQRHATANAFGDYGIALESVGT